MIRRFYGDVYRFAMCLCRDEIDAIDLTQQTFYRYAKHEDRVHTPAKLKSWLFATAKNEFLDHVRRAKRYPHVSLEEVGEPSSGGAETSRAVDTRIVLAAMRRIDETYRTALALFYLEGYSYREISEILEVPSGTVMSRLSRGKAQLKAALDDGNLKPQKSGGNCEH
ncbi:MAG: sigma-70 family RNA polymerase sigma factor [Verrucomicrobiota bacterium]